MAPARPQELDRIQLDSTDKDTTMTPRTIAIPRTTRRTNPRRASSTPTLARLREWFYDTGLDRTGTVTFTLITGATESR